MKYLILPLLLIAGSLLLLLNYNRHYSPLDSYIQGQMESIEDSTRHAKEVSAFLDSINHK